MVLTFQERIDAITNAFGIDISTYKATFEANRFEENEISGAAISSDTKKNVAEKMESKRSALGNIATVNTNLKEMLNSFNVGDYAISSDIGTLKEQLERDRDVAKLRESQNEALNNRDAANFHTSWMGLVRPMKEKSRTGLFIAAIGFLLIGIFALVYMIQTYYNRADSIPDFLSFSTFKGIGGKRIRK
jgi:hypothetical protein